jgi:hypothetical protein
MKSLNVSFVTILITCLTICLVLTGCGTNNNPYGHYSDNEMIGFVNTVNEQEEVISLDISEWKKRHEKGANTDTIGYSFTAHISPNTLIRTQDGDTVTWKDIKIGQKVQIIPVATDAFNGEPEELLILSMPKEEVYKRKGLLASKKESYRTIVMHAQGTVLYDDTVFRKEVPQAYKGGISWLTYDSNYVIDFMREFEIESLPAIMIFDSQKLIYKTDNIEDVSKFFGSQ